jgi:hypothetical protein
MGVTDAAQLTIVQQAAIAALAKKPTREALSRRV